MKKICFLYIDEPYNIYHSLSIAIELHNSYESDVTVLCTERNYKFVDETLKKSNARNLKVTIVRPYWHFTLSHYIEIKIQFRYFIFHRYKKLLSSFDGIVCSLYNDLLLKKFINAQSKTKLIYARHGIANSAYSYDNKVKGFDYLLLAGEKEKKVRHSLNQLVKDHYCIAGYVKYDVCRDMITKDPFSNNKPIVLYNPHWNKEHSSFYKFGYSILEQFANQDKYNFIFAPHSLLTTRNKSIIPEIMRYKEYKNIHIDLGSEASNNMSYIKISDIYLGDVSSQALEFLLHKKRPCLYLNNKAQSDSNYDFDSWELGSVVSDVNDLLSKLEEAKNQHESIYLEKQNKEIAKVFYRGEKSATKIAAFSIFEYLNKIDLTS